MERVSVPGRIDRKQHSSNTHYFDILRKLALTVDKTQIRKFKPNRTGSKFNIRRIQLRKTRVFENRECFHEK